MLLHAVSKLRLVYRSSIVSHSTFGLSVEVVKRDLIEAILAYLNEIDANQ